MEGIVRGEGKEDQVVDLPADGSPYDLARYNGVPALRYTMKVAGAVRAVVAYSFFRKSSVVMVHVGGPIAQFAQVKVLGEQIARSIRMPVEVSATFGKPRGKPRVKDWGFKVGQYLGGPALLLLLASVVVLLLRRRARHERTMVSVAAPALPLVPPSSTMPPSLAGGYPALPIAIGATVLVRARDKWISARVLAVNATHARCALADGRTLWVAHEAIQTTAAVPSQG
jgi:hypothetical protein